MIYYKGVYSIFMLMFYWKYIIFCTKIKNKYPNINVVYPLLLKLVFGVVYIAVRHETRKFGLLLSCIIQFVFYVSNQTKIFLTFVLVVTYYGTLGVLLHG